MIVNTGPLLIAAAGAVRPWQSIDAEPIDDRRRRRYAAVFTEQTEIDKCLACPRPECCDCKRKRKSAGRTRSKQ